MRFFVACNIPDRKSRLQIGFDQISPSAPPIESFRFEDEYDYEIKLKKRKKIDTPESFILLFLFTEKVSTVMYTEGGYTVSTHPIAKW